MRHVAPQSLPLRGLALLALLCVWSPLLARADDSLDAGLTALDEGEFDNALTAFDAALAGDALSRPELLALLEARAALHFALHDDAALDLDLSWLAALDPGHGFGANRPPDLAHRFVEIEQHHPGALEVTATALPSDNQLSLRASIANVPEGMNARLRICGRSEGSAWRCVDGDDLSLALSSASGVHYYAEAVGPGGATVGSAGSATDPLHFNVASATTAEGTREAAGGLRATAGDPPAHGGHGLAIGLGVGGGVLLVAVTVVLALTLGGGGGIHVRTPTVQ